MSSYLEEYASQSWRFGKLAKAAGALLLAGVVGYCFYWLFFRNWREESRVRDFLSLVEQGRYEQAYERWGCSVAEPCRFYTYESFLEDWGPESPLGKVSSYKLGRTYTQDNGVIVEIVVNGEEQPRLWVQRDTRAIGFFPY